MDQCEPVERERDEWPAAAGVPVTGVENEVDALDAVYRLGRDLGRVDRAVAKAEELEGDPDAQPVSPVAGQLERVARPRNGAARFEPGRTRRDRQQVWGAQVLADPQPRGQVILDVAAIHAAVSPNRQRHA